MARLLPEPAERSLDRIAAALDITTAILSRGLGSAPAAGPGPGGLLEASALLRAFVGIDDPAIRRRCLAFVQAEAKAAPAA